MTEMSYEVYENPASKRMRPSAMAMGALFSYGLFEISATINDRLKRTSEPVVKSLIHPHPTRSTVSISGFHSDGVVIGNIKAPALAQEGNYHVVGWGKSGLRLDIAKEKLFNALVSDDGLPLHIDLSSWALHPFTDWMSDPEFRKPLENREVIIVGDSNFYDLSDISLPTRLAMLSTRVLPPTFTPAKMFEVMMGMDDTDIRVHDRMVTDEQIETWKDSSAKAPYGAAIHQITDIRSRRGNYPHFADAYQGIGEFRFVSAIQDPVANPFSSFNKIRGQLGEKARHFVDLDRPKKSHAMGPAYSNNLAKLLYFSHEQLMDEPQFKLMPPGAKDFLDYYKHELELVA